MSLLLLLHGEGRYAVVASGSSASLSDDLILAELDDDPILVMNMDELLTASLIDTEGEA
jgi:hypothetical protein